MNVSFTADHHQDGDGNNHHDDDNDDDDNDENDENIDPAFKTASSTTRLRSNRKRSSGDALLDDEDEEDDRGGRRERSALRGRQAKVLRTRSGDGRDGREEYEPKSGLGLGHESSRRFAEREKTRDAVTVASSFNGQ